jgi:photosystem II stability/assembly factor-like uncharacterized protein
VPVALWAALGDGIAHVDDGDVERFDVPARCVTAAGAVAFAGGDGVWRYDGTWRRMPFEGDVFSIAVAADGTVYAGTEPSALYRSRDGGETWEELDALQRIPSKPNWSFPPRPWTSHVRWIAPSPHDLRVLLVGIELGGLMRSDDGGGTFADHAPDAQPDVHSLTWHPREPDRAYEAGGGGSAWSRDGGATWERVDRGRDRHYTWAVAVDPEDPDRWWVSASTGPYAAHGRGDPQARIYEWRDDAWSDVSGPLQAMPYAFAQIDGRLVAGLADGSLLDVESGELRPLGLGRVAALA